MKDIPVFTSEYGVASLVLKDIPYWGVAYITIQSSQEPALLLEECVGFCRACGAEKIYAKGDAYLQRFPLHTAVVTMRRLTEGLPLTDAALWPVLPENGGQWQTIYNEKMAGVPNAAFMTSSAVTQMLEKGDGYFVHRDGVLLGIGRVSGGSIDVVASVQPGSGRDVVLALATLLTEETVSLTVASANEKAVKLYEKLGFLQINEISRWYQIR